MTKIIQASKIVFKDKNYIFLTLIFFVVFFILYIFILPATYTGGRIGFVSLRLITPSLALFAFIFSVLLAPALSFAVYAFKKKQGIGGSSAAGSFFGSVLPPLLCCSPLLPSLAAVVSGAIPFAFGISGFVQGFMATYEIEIFIAIIFILIYSLHQNARQVIKAKSGVCIY